MPERHDLAGQVPALHGLLVLPSQGAQAVTRREDLDLVLEEYQKVTMLAPLAFGSPLVPPSGPLTSPVVLVGEAPGRDEAARLEPFVGRAGQLLDYKLKMAGLRRDLLYVTNVVLYRPPGNRPPYPYEIIASAPRLLAELAIVRPVVVVTLGATAWRALGTEGIPYATARGHWHRLAYANGVPPADLLVTWHPAAALRDQRADRELADHLSLIMRNPDGSSNDGGKAS